MNITIKFNFFFFLEETESEDGRDKVSFGLSRVTVDDIGRVILFSSFNSCSAIILEQKKVYVFFILFFFSFWRKKTFRITKKKKTFYFLSQCKKKTKETKEIFFFFFFFFIYVSQRFVFLLCRNLTLILQDKSFGIIKQNLFKHSTQDIVAIENLEKRLNIKSSILSFLIKIIHEQRAKESNSKPKKENQS